MVINIYQDFKDCKVVSFCEIDRTPETQNATMQKKKTVPLRDSVTSLTQKSHDKLGFIYFL